MAVKGLTEPVEVVRAVGVGAVRTPLPGVGGARPDAVRRAGGRDRPSLREALDRAGAGHGQVVALVGEPGVGKSRLVWEVTQARRGRRAGGAPEPAPSRTARPSPYLPVIDLLKHVLPDRAARRRRAPSREGHRHACWRSTRRWSRSCRRCSRCWTCRSRMPPGRRSTRPAVAAQTLDALQRLLLRESQEQPLLLVFEDLHWIDAETQALLDAPGREPAGRPHPAAGQLPPGVHPRLGQQELLHPAPDRPAGAGERRGAARRPAGRRPERSQPLKALLIERTEGNPFFLEESVRALVETGALAGERGAYRLSRARSTTSACRPRSRRSWRPASTACRRRTSGCSRRRRSSARTCRSRCSRPSPRCRMTSFGPACRGSRRPSSCTRSSLFPEPEYTFKHALTHEVAYGSLLQDRRRALHARIVAAIERLLPRPPGRARRAAGPPRPARRGLGAGRRLLRAGPARDWRPLGVPRGGASTSSRRSRR